MSSWLSVPSLRERACEGQHVTVRVQHRKCYVHRPVNGGTRTPRRAFRLGDARRHCAGAAVLAAGVALASCGSATPPQAADAGGMFEVTVTQASFPASQRLSEHTHMVIAVRNAGGRTIPNLAATVCNVTCVYPAPPGEGTSAGAFAADITQPDVGNPSRPTWIVDSAPGPCGSSCAAGGPGSGATAYSNTWALGRLAPGQTKVFDWAVTTVGAGRHVVAWVLAAALSGNARAVLTNGSTAHGTFTVDVHTKPVQSYVSNSGQIVTTH